MRQDDSDMEMESLIIARLSKLRFRWCYPAAIWWMLTRWLPGFNWLDR